MENNASPAPVYRLVGQLRELLAKVPVGAWGPQHNNYGTGVLIRQPDDFINVCWWDCESTHDHTEDCRDLIVAAINAMPALLAIAEAANLALDHMDGNDLPAWLSESYLALGAALSLPPNAQVSGPPSGGSTAPTCWADRTQETNQ